MDPYDLTILCRGAFPVRLLDGDKLAIVEVTVYRLNATAIACYDIDGPESVLHHLGASAADTYITRHEVDDIVTVVHPVQSTT